MDTVRMEIYVAAKSANYVTISAISRQIFGLLFANCDNT